MDRLISIQLSLTRIESLKPLASTASASPAARRATLNNITNASLLRGVPSSKVLQGCGELLRIPRQGWQHFMTHGEGEALYNMSREVDVLDLFISHSWRDGRWHKYLCILFLFNHTSMMVCMHLVSAIWFGLMWLGTPLPKVEIEFYRDDDEHIAFTTGCIIPVAALTYVASCFCVHKVRRKMHEGLAKLGLVRYWSWSWTSGDPVLFLDKCCIHQLDPDMKAAGIRSLGGFLHRSRRMLVLWSPEYFNRLWCVYELACYSSLKGWSNIIIMPLFFPVSIFLVVIVIAIGFVMAIFPCALDQQSCQDIWGSGDEYWLDTTVVFVLGFILGRAQRRLEVFCLQLKNFELAEAECYCCSVAHKVPDSGTLIPCDRQFVEDNIKRWFADVNTSNGVEGIDTSNEVEGIKTFERHVRDNIGDRIKHPIWSNTIFTVISSLTTWHCLEVGLLTPSQNTCWPGWFYPKWSVALWWFTYPQLFFLSIGLMKKSMRRLIHACEHASLGRTSVVLDLAAGFFLSSYFVILFYVYDKFWVYHRKDFVVLSCMSAFLASLVLLLFFEGAGYIKGRHDI